jgi:mobilome CxxCx(11)CxxC protein
MMTDEAERICQECWDRATYAYGTGAIFLLRSRRYKQGLRALTFLGIAIPVLIGGVVLAFGTGARYLPYLLTSAGLLGIFQLGLSAWSLAYTWPDSLEYSLESAAENFDISEKFKELAKQASVAAVPPEFPVRYAEVKARDDARMAADNKKQVTEKELRYGHRAGLRQFGRECEGCHHVPVSMDPTDCPVCGRF